MFERNFILKALEQARWNVTATARSLGVPLSTLKFKMDRLDIREIARKLQKHRPRLSPSGSTGRRQRWQILQRVPRFDVAISATCLVCGHSRRLARSGRAAPVPRLARTSPISSSDNE